MFTIFEVFSLLIIIFYLSFFNVNSYKIQKICILFTFFVFIVSVFQFTLFDYSSIFIQDYYIIPFFNFGVFNFIIGIDGLSMCLILLTTFLIYLCFIISYNTIFTNVKSFCINLLILEVFLILTFSSLNIFFFYIFFESTLIPMYLIIGSWGSKVKKTRAAFLFFIYTLIGSLCMLYAILFIYSINGTLDYCTLINFCIESLIPNGRYHEATVLVYIDRNINMQGLIWDIMPIWFAFFIAFAVKTPIVPFHVWLPEAHVEAPTIGSIILAGILLKLGIFGFLKYLFVFCPNCNIDYKIYVYILCIFSIIYSSVLAFRQNDLKKLIAYASIAHMNIIVLGLFSFNEIGINGSIFQAVAHYFTASGLFLCAGNLYDRYHTRLIKYYGGFDKIMPKFSIIFFIYILANMSFPGTSNFIGELLILKGIFSISKFISILAATSLFLSCVYSLIFFLKISKGPVSGFIIKTSDLTKNEILIHYTFIFFIFLFGFFPNIVIDLVRGTSIFILEIHSV